jgi:hypothetical protein
VIAREVEDVVDENQLGRQSITFVSGSVKRETRSTGLVWLLVGQPAASEHVASPE